jgi:LPXTG-motif cell wall-anchored protein
MATRWLSRLAVASMVVGIVTVASQSAAWADPPGNNGTVKINSQDVDDGISNEPHVPCDFQVEFFGFDEGQTATITFTIHPPSGQGDVLLSETQTVSDDPAAGGLNDVDEVFQYSGTSFGLDRFEAQPQQGFHVKLTVESEGVPGGKKHKVFWLQCVQPTPSPSVSPSESPTAPSATATTTAPGMLPVTGIGVGGMMGVGAAMIGIGAALVFLRRRRAAAEGDS